MEEFENVEYWLFWEPGENLEFPSLLLTLDLDFLNNNWISTYTDSDV